MLKTTATTQRRTALLLLLCLWFQSGVALGSAFAGSASGLSVLCRNGALVTLDLDDAERHAAANLPCLACAQTGDDDPVSSTPATGGSASGRAVTTSVDDDTLAPQAPSRRCPPARAPPGYA